jgi:hypothetical protein
MGNPISPLTDVSQDQNNEKTDEFGEDDEMPHLEGESEDEGQNPREGREAKVMRDPGAPTQSEIYKHNMTHVPFRSWCPACVAGMAK